MNNGLKVLVCILALVFFGFYSAYAFEPIPITISGSMDEVIFDGKWTFEYEWKKTSLNTYSYHNDTTIILRSAHQGDFVYILLDPITDLHPNKDDHAIICFDSRNDKSDKADLDDYCFTTTLDGKDGFAYQGGHPSTGIDYDKIPNPDGFVGIGGISDINDRYTPIPHPSYEFKIPTSLIGRESVYGFYFSVYNDNSTKSYTYPQNAEPGTFAPNPSQWGEIYSPDKSLPEFELPLFLMVLSILPIIILTRTGYFGKISNENTSNI